MSNASLEDTILQAVDIVASKKIASAGYDKTIQATVLSCVDATIGKYKVQYQNSSFFAYSSNIDTSYSNGSSVYILVPGGDMNNDKTILGTTKKLGINYITVAEGDQRYSPIGTNIIISRSSQDLCSYKTETKILYSVNNNTNELNINIEAAEEYLKNSNYIIAGGYIRTKLNVEQQYQGNYGITFALDFIDNATQNQVTRYYTVDIDKMSGNPYRFINETRQYGIFEIDGINFVRINSIFIFVKDFPVTSNQDKESDIFISNLELGGAVSLSEDDINGCALVLLTPQGYIFDQNNTDDDTKTIKAQLRVKGKTVDTKSQSLSFYWFIENLLITPKSKQYSKYGGQGWQCLNKYNVIQRTEYDQGGNKITFPIVEFLPGKEIINIKKSQSLTKRTKYKCAVIYQGQILTKQIAIINQDSEYQIDIESNEGTQFYYDIGNPTLTCICKKKNQNGIYVEIGNLNTLKFIWGYTNNVNNFSTLTSTDEYNEDYANLVLLQESIEDYLKAEWLLHKQLYDVNKLIPDENTIDGFEESGKRTKVRSIKNKIIAKQLTINKIEALFTKYQINITTSTTWESLLNASSSSKTLSKVVNSFNTIQRVEKNKVINLNIKDITQFATYKCSVFTVQGNHFLGTSSIKINNILEGQDLYSLVINNGSQVFKYNTHGVAPTSKQNKIPFEIPTLTFTIFDNLGNPIDDNVIKHSDITWTVPASNTLLKVSYEVDNTNDNLTPEQILNIASNKVKIFTGRISFDYTIAERFDSNKTQNNIELKVNYKGLNLVAKTDFTFTKQGASGTNGTDFVCKIVPNATSGSIPLYPTIYYDGQNVSFNWNHVTRKWFKAQLWHNGTEPIFSDVESGESTEGKLVTVVKWQVLKNKYGINKQDSTNFNITQTGNGWIFSFNPGVLSNDWDQDEYEEWKPANIIKVTLSYDGYTYYGTLPVIIVRNFYENNYRINLKDNTGFREVLYSSSGVQPEYDSHAPFELTVEKLLGGNRWQDVSKKTYKEDRLGFRWSFLGSVWNREKRVSNNGTVSYDWVEDAEQKKWLMDWNSTSTQLLTCQLGVKPADNYDGQCLNTAIACRILKAIDKETVAWVHIPIHMLRNRFSNSAINGWDGNSVELGGTNGGTILAPQVGAGFKDANNRFTGILIGTAKDPKEDTSDQKSNTANSSQGIFAKADEEVGLFGYHEGSRSIFLDAKTGKAVFGESGQAQIVLDPSQMNGNTGKKVARIQSGDYNYEPDDNNAVELGNVTRQPTGRGMMIDLSTPQIKFGSGNFEVDSNGHVIARGGGSIGGWQMNDTSLYNRAYGNSVAINTTGMNSNPIVLQGNGSEIRSIKVPPTSNDGNTGYHYEPKAAAFWAGSNKFIVTHDGYLHAEQASIGSGAKPIYIGTTTQLGKAGSESVIFSGRKNAKNANQLGFYLGTDGLGIGSTFTIGVLKQNAPVDNSLYDSQTGAIKSEFLQNRNISNFQVDSNGMFYARRGYIGNGRQGWQIGNTFLRNNKLNLNDTTSSTGVYMGTDGISLGRVEEINENGDSLGTYTNAFKITNEGDLTAIRGRIANWVISNNSIRTAGTVGQENPDRYSRTVGGKTIVESTGMYFGKGGLRLGANFHVDSNGKLYADQGEFAGKITTESGFIGDWRIDSSGIKNGSVQIYPTGITLGNLTLDSTGAITATGWSITAGGNANFSNMNMSGGTITGGTIGSNSSSIGPTLKPTTIGISGGSVSGNDLNLESYIQELVVNKLKVDYKLEVGTGNQAGIVIFNTNARVTFKKAMVNFLDSTSIKFASGSCTIFAGEFGEKAGRTGKATFSGGGWMQFSNGILIDVQKADDDIAEWTGV